MATFKPDMNLPKLAEQFRSEDSCRKFFEDLRWPGGVACIRCGSLEGIARLPKRHQYECASCDFQFSVTAGTAMHDTHLPLWKWMVTTLLMVEAKKGISAKQLQRTLGLSYKTAWYLCHRVRHAMGSVAEAPLSGKLEMDETYVGGKKRGVGQGDASRHKAIIVGALQRGGPIRLRMEKRTTTKTMRAFLDHYAKDVSDLYTDEALTYKGLKHPGHKFVNHRQEEWVSGEAHTQGIENVWGLFKRSIVGSYHQLSRKHLPSYIDELEWRFNGRKNPFLFRDTCMALLKAEALPLKDLVEGKAA